MKTSTLFLLFCTFWFVGCDREKAVVTPLKASISPINREYQRIDSLKKIFVAEGLKRGKTVSFEGITIRFTNIISKGFWGYANENGLVELDSTTWYFIAPAMKEWLLFHELGHAVLKRTHQNRTMPNGEFFSVMFDGKNFGYGSIYYYGSKRKFYLDELFDPKSEPPMDFNQFDLYTSVKDTQKKVINSESFEDKSTVWNTGGGNLVNGGLTVTPNAIYNCPIEIGKIDNFEVEFEVKGTFGNLSIDLDEKSQIDISVNLDEQAARIQLPYLKGLSVILNDKNIVKKAINTITVRKIGNYYQLYANETAIYKFEAIAIKTKKPFIIPSYFGEEILIDNFKFSSLD